MTSRLTMATGIFLLAATIFGGSAFAHGPLIFPVTNPIPTTPVPGFTPGGRATPGNITPGGRAAPTPTPAPGTTPSGTPTGTPGTTPSPAPVRPPAGVVRPGSGGVATGATTPRGRKMSSHAGLAWEYWWVANRDRFLRPRLGRNVSRTQAGAVDLASLARRDDVRLRVSVVPILQQALGDPSPAVRRDAAIALGKVGAPAAPAMLRDALRDTNRSVRQAAILGLGLMKGPRCVDQLTAVLGNTLAGRKLVGLARIPNSSRAHAATALGLAGPSAHNAVPALLDVAENKRTADSVAEAAVHALGMIEAVDAAPRLLGMANRRDGSTTVRAAAVAALAKIGDRGALESCVGLLKHRDAAVRRSATVAIGRLANSADNDAVRALIQTARADADQATRHFALMALGEAGGSEARDALVATLRSGSGATRGFAALALGVQAREHGDPEADDLTTWLKKVVRHDDNDRVRGAAATALGLMERHDAVPTLLAMLDGPRRSTNRIDAALALGLVGDVRATKPLKEATATTKDPALRIIGALSLGLIGDASAIKALTEALTRDGGLALSGATLVGLGRIGGVDVVDAIGDMTRRSGRSQSDLRASAVRALGSLSDRRAMPAAAFATIDTNFADWSSSMKDRLGKL